MKKVIIAVAIVAGVFLSFNCFAQMAQQQSGIPCDNLADCQNKKDADTATYAQLNAQNARNLAAYNYASRKIQSILSDDETKISNFQSNNSI